MTKSPTSKHEKQRKYCQSEWLKEEVPDFVQKKQKTEDHFFKIKPYSSDCIWPRGFVTVVLYKNTMWKSHMIYSHHVTLYHIMLFLLRITMCD